MIFSVIILTIVGISVLAALAEAFSDSRVHNRD